MILELKRRLSPRTVTAVVGEDILFYCHSVVPVKWTFEGGPLPPNSKEKFDKSGGHINQLFLQNIQLENTGTYRCLGEDNNYVKFEEDGVLTVIGK